MSGKLPACRCSRKEPTPQALGKLAACRTFFEETRLWPRQLPIPPRTLVGLTAGARCGPKAMIINELAGSGGDAMPWFFRKMKIGPLVGKRTWGGLVAVFGIPPLMDGDSIRVPDAAIYGLDGEWEVENVGVGPDIKVDFDPKA